MIELPGVAAVARELVAAAGASERVVLRDGDYHSADFGSGKDVVLMSGMFHRETEQACRGLIERAAACLNPGGLLVVSDVFTDQGGCQPTFAAMFGLNMMLTAPDGGVHADVDVMRWMADKGFRDLRWCRCRHRCRTGSCLGSSRERTPTLLACSRHGDSLQSADALGQTVAPPPPAPPPIGELKSLGQERYQVGRIVIDKRARSFTVPGRVHVLGKPLEYLATSPGGMKAYETLLELDATGSEFNLACILIGLERDPKQVRWQALRQADTPGRPAGRHLRCLGRRTASGARCRLRRRCSIRMPASSPNRSNGSTSARRHRRAEDRFAADVTGTLIGFKHDANSIIESAVWHRHRCLRIGARPCDAAARRLGHRTGRPSGDLTK